VNERAPAARRLLTRLAGARLCYGKPVRVGDRAIVPVARVRAVGGGGWGSEDEQRGGGGGGGTLSAQPVGFIDIGPEGSHFEAIPDPDRTAKLIKAGAVAIATVLAASAVRHRLATSGRSSRSRRRRRR
jgi:uncharacterized spore protein YtfJ